MKKFTGNFLLDEHGFGNVLRRIGLSMVAILMAVVAFAQAQDTYHVFAENADDECYRFDNNYEVDISFRDFVKIDTFVLVLDYDETVFSYVNATDVHDALDTTSTFMITEMAGGKLQIEWDSKDNPLLNGTIEPNNDTTVVFTLNFKLDDYPHKYGPVNNYVFETDLEWEVFKFWDEFGQVTDILTSDHRSDGSIAVTQGMEMEDIVIDNSAASCDGDQALVTITSPDIADLMYSFNGQTFTDNPSTDVEAPSLENTVRVRNGACVSYYKEFDVDAPKPLEYAADDTVYTNCPGGLGDIEILAKNGVKPYTYYIVEDANWAQVMDDMDQAINKAEGMEVAGDYEVTNNVLQREVGIYYVAVQDANICKDMRDPMWWTMVEVMDTLTAWDVAIEVTNMQCWLPDWATFADGIIEVVIDGATPFAEGYKIWFNDDYQGINDSLVVDDLVHGEYTIHIEDANGCDYDKTVKITKPEPITFWVDHTDASCNQDLGTITIDTASIEGGHYTPDFAGWYWIYSTSPDFAAEVTDTILDVNVTAENLPVGVYYVMLFDEVGCSGQFENINKDHAVKLLTTDFELVYDAIECTGDSTTVSIVLTEGDGNHEFEYSVDGGAYGTSNQFRVAAGPHTFSVHDITIDCTNTWTTGVVEPNPLTAEIVPLHTLPPTCPGNTDGNLTIHVTGGTPWVGSGYKVYNYKVGEGNWIKGGEYNTFAVSTDEITIYIQDSTGKCPITVKYDWPDMENIIEFQDTIYNVCAGGAINLFNRVNEGCEPVMFDVYEIYGLPTDAELAAMPFDMNNMPPGLSLDMLPATIPPGFSLQDLADILNAAVNSYQGNTTFDFWNPSYYNCPAQETPDYGYLLDLQWYGIPIEKYTGVIDFEIAVWTSDSGWVTRTLQGIQQLRDPALYWTSTDPGSDPMAVVTNGEVIGHNTSFEAGVYWVVAKDEWGCYSNIEKITVMDPAALEVVVTPYDAGCAGSTDGKIVIEASNGTEAIPNLLKPFARYQYVLTQQPEIFAQDNWVGEASWLPFASGEFLNDSVGELTVQAGTYWLAVRDWCSVEDEDLMQFVGPITVEGAEPIEIDITDDMITNIDCNTGTGEDASTDGAITGLLDATTGGFGDYTFTLVGGDVDETNQTGNFVDLPAGTYDLNVEDSKGCYLNEEITITEPDMLMLETVVVHPSCFDAHDGILRYIISGGTAPYMEATNNVGNWESAMDIPANRWVDTSSEAYKAPHGWIFDRRVRAGEYDIWIKDAKGCYYHLEDSVVVKEPGMLKITEVETKSVICDGSSTPNNGTIEFMPVGGWNMFEDGFLYYAELWSGDKVLETATLDTLKKITFDAVEAGDYSIKLYEYNTTIESLDFENPVISYVYYFEDHDWLSFAPWQNPFLSKTDTDEPCYIISDVTVTAPVDITYDDIEWFDVLCHNTHTGAIEITNITGGVPSATEGYYVGLEGPVDYDATLQSNILTNDEGVELATGIHWFNTGEGINDFKFDNLIWGHYTVHIKDTEGCWIYKESGEIENQDTLKIIVVEKTENGDAGACELGEIQIDAVGGTPPYMYAVDSTLVPHPGSHFFPNDLDLDAYLAGLAWQESDTFRVSPATWIGYVKDANGCVTGFSTFENGDPVYHHRTNVLGKQPVVAMDFGDMDDQQSVICFGESNGAIVIDTIYGGDGGAWSIEVTGTDAAGNVVEKTYPNITSSGNVKLTGLPASTNKTEIDSMTAEDYYTVVVYDVNQCASIAYMQFVTQPGPFVVVLKDKQNAFICPNDQAGLFEIEVVSGGNPFGIGVDEEPLYKYKWEAFEDSAMTMLIDSLSDDEYGFVTTFLGHAGIHYKVYALDALGCETTRDTFIQAPEEIMFSVTDITCFGDVLASARVRAKGTPGRSFQVEYREFENDIAPDDWTVYNGWFNDSIDIMDEFIFDNADDVANPIDYHYAFRIVDTLGCQSDIAYITFDSVQHALAIRVDVVSEDECTADAEIFVTGGIPPYAVTIDGMATTDMMVTLMAGEHTIKVTDSHLLCMDEVTVDVVAEPVVAEEEVMTYIGEKVEYANVEAGVDTMLAEGMHTFMYMHMMDTVMGCERTLEVTVVAVPRPLTIVEVQGEADASPWVDAVVGVTGTITGISAGEGFYMQDANAAWSGIWVEWTDTEALQIGQGVEVAGTVAEVASVTTLIATDVMPAIAPVIVEAVMVDAPTDAENEMYESVLVKVDGARATAADAGTGEWSIYYAEIDDVVVNDLLYAYTPVEGDIYNVTGIVNARLDAFKLEPRMADDIVNVSETTDIGVIETVQFKVYPNPFNDRIMIDNNDSLTRVVVSNIAGQRVIDVEYPSHEIRTANLASGVYTVSMFTESGLAKTERIVKR